MDDRGKEVLHREIWATKIDYNRGWGKITIRIILLGV